MTRTPLWVYLLCYGCIYLAITGLGMAFYTGDPMWLLLILVLFLLSGG